ncbi:MAG: TIGR03000 domain-containing protein, partial [Gemmata sp.]
MYSIVLMTALSAAPDAPQFNGYFRDLFQGNSCNGCNGCSGGARYSCSGGGCSGAVAYPASCSGCSGCCGGGSVFGLGLGDRMRSFFDGGSGCCGARSYGCTGSSLSCSGYSCSGSSMSCFGAAAYSYTPTFLGGLSCQGGLMYAAPPAPLDQFSPSPGQPGIPYAIPDAAPGATGQRPAGGASPALTGSTAQSRRATVVVRLPADARLSADGRPLNLTGAERRFVSPELPADQEFVYRFKVEYERDGETVSVTKKVPVRAGLTATVEFVDLMAAKPIAGAAGF